MTADTTIVITSCKRPDDLDQTLASIAARDLSAVKRIIVIEDSDHPGIAPVVATRLGDIPHLFLQNETTLGQIASIDRAYAEVDTPYIFHCEDDWLFPTSLFIAESRAILAARPDVHAVMMRAWSEAPDAQNQAAPGEIAGVGVRIADPKAHRRWGSFSFNPGLRRTADYAAHAPYARIGPERDLSHYHKLRGFRLVYLEAGDVTHIGFAPTVKTDEIRRKKAKGFLLKSLWHRLQFAWFKRFG
ncbi:glycosyltransferase family 2 protein [Tateyamaria sp. SN6-1]|uniref:glycosyltransferase family 2 protein n=1 Tax=Tateyamaria sp. SN6-1 TaxID=3092148 RepID=UPI0039F584EF